MAKYDMAVSFAGEQREIAESLSRRLDAAGYSIFYDQLEVADLWGLDLSVSLGKVYAQDARFCLVLLSREYLDKAWTNFERQNAISRFMRDKENYILCLKLDDVKLPGLPDVISYVDYKNFGEDGVYKLLLQKLGQPNHDDSISRLSQSDQTISAQIIKACYRRAIFTRMTFEIDLRAMYTSVGHAIGTVQSLIPDIKDQALQYVALEIIAALDAIERVKLESDAMVSNRLQQDLWKEIDRQKTKVIRLLLEIRRAANISIQLPFSLRIAPFFGQESADSPPLLNDNDWPYIPNPKIEKNCKNSFNGNIFEYFNIFKIKMTDIQYVLIFIYLVSGLVAIVCFYIMTATGVKGFIAQLISVFLFAVILHIFKKVKEKRNKF